MPHSRLTQTRPPSSSFFPLKEVRILILLGDNYSSHLQSLQNKTVFSISHLTPRTCLEVVFPKYNKVKLINVNMLNLEQLIAELVFSFKTYTGKK